MINFLCSLKYFNLVIHIKNCLLNIIINYFLLNYFASLSKYWFDYQNFLKIINYLIIIIESNHFNFLVSFQFMYQYFHEVVNHF